MPPEAVASQIVGGPRRSTGVNAPDGIGTITGFFQVPVFSGSVTSVAYEVYWPVSVLRDVRDYIEWDRAEMLDYGRSRGFYIPTRRSPEEWAWQPFLTCLQGRPMEWVDKPFSAVWWSP